MEAVEIPLSLANEGGARAVSPCLLSVNADQSLITLRERQCLDLASNGMTSADIGVKLGIAERTVNFHFGNVFAKLGVLNRAEAIAQAWAKQLLPLSRVAAPVATGRRNGLRR